MNRSLPVLLVGIVIAVLAVEGKLTALWGAIAKNGRTIGQNLGTGTYPPASAPTGTKQPPSQNIGTGVYPPGGPDPGPIAVGIGGTIAQIIANHKFAVANPGTDPALDRIVNGWPASSDPAIADLFQQFLSCYLNGSDATSCVQRLPRSPFG